MVGQCSIYFLAYCLSTTFVDEGGDWNTTGCSQHAEHTLGEDSMKSIC